MRIAFGDHPVINDDGGTVAVIDLAGKKTVLTPQYATASGIGWSPDGSEVWFSAADVGANRSLRAAAADGSLRTRVLARAPGTLTLHDVARDGRVLVAQDSNASGVVALAPGAEKDVDLSWLDWSLLSDISSDGRTVAFAETGEGGSPGYSAYIRGTDGSTPVRLGEGSGPGFSADGKSVVAIVHSATEGQMVIYPTGPGETTPLPTPGLRVMGARFLPDGRILFIAAPAGRGRRLPTSWTRRRAPRNRCPTRDTASCGSLPTGEKSLPSIPTGGPSSARSTATNRAAYPASTRRIRSPAGAPTDRRSTCAAAG